MKTELKEMGQEGITPEYLEMISKLKDKELANNILDTMAICAVFGAWCEEFEVKYDFQSLLKAAEYAAMRGGM